MLNPICQPQKQTLTRKSQGIPQGIPWSTKALCFGLFLTAINTVLCVQSYHFFHNAWILLIVKCFRTLTNELVQHVCRFKNVFFFAEIMISASSISLFLVPPRRDLLRGRAHLHRRRAAAEDGAVRTSAVCGSDGAPKRAFSWETLVLDEWNL